MASWPQLQKNIGSHTEYIIWQNYATLHCGTLLKFGWYGNDMSPVPVLMSEYRYGVFPEDTVSTFYYRHAVMVLYSVSERGSLFGCVVAHFCTRQLYTTVLRQKPSIELSWHYFKGFGVGV